MKTINLKSGLGITMAISFVFVINLTLLCVLTGCEDQFTKDQCAVQDKGWVMVENASSVNLDIDVTTGTQKENDPIFIEGREEFGTSVSTKFDGIPAGTAKVWYKIQTMEWQFAFIEVCTCEETYFRITNETLFE